jgi:tetratricopeptide (TPR) repeat protein
MKIKNIVGCLVLGLLLTFVFRSQAEDVKKQTEPIADKNSLPAKRPVFDFGEIFKVANQAYLDEDYEQAIKKYNKLVEGGVRHPDLYFNLANAYYRAGRKGLAVLFYEKTLDLDPADESATSNLEMVRKELIDRVVLAEDGTVGEPLWHGFLRSISVGWLTWTFLVVYVLAFVLMIVKRLVRAEYVKRLLFWINIPLLSIVIVFASLLAGRIYIQEKIHHAVVVPMTAKLLVGPERSAKVLMEVHEGLKVRLLNEVGDYIRVRLANGVEGFVRDSHLGKI